MDDAPFLMFLGYLAAMKVIALDFDQDKDTYVERTTGKTVGEIAREFLRDVQPHAEVSAMNVRIAKALAENDA